MTGSEQSVRVKRHQSGRPFTNHPAEAADVGRAALGHAASICLIQCPLAEKRTSIYWRQDVVSEGCCLATISHTSNEGMGMKTDQVVGHAVIKQPLAYIGKSEPCSYSFNWCTPTHSLTYTNIKYYPPLIHYLSHLNRSVEAAAGLTC